MIDNIVLYVELDGQIWMVMTDGSWLPLSDINLMSPDLPLLTNVEEIIQIQNFGEFAFSYNDQTFIVDPQVTQYTPSPKTCLNNQSTAENVTLSSGGGLGGTTRLLVDGDEVLADAGYQTHDFTPDETVEAEDNNELVGRLDDQAQLTISIDDGNDSVLNQYEVPLANIYGTSIEVEDGVTVVITVFDEQGNTLEFTTTVTGNTWSLGEVDLSSLSEGPIRLEAVVADNYGNHVDVLTTSNIDSLASLDIHFESETNDSVVNRFEVDNEGLSGIVNNVENGQVISIVITDSNGKQETFSTTVLDGKWSIENNDLSVFAEGELTAVATVTDLAGNVATSTSTIIKDTFAQITLTLESGDDGWLNIDEIRNASLKGSVFGVEDGQIVTIVAMDSNGTIKTVTAEVIDGKYSVSGLNGTALRDFTLKILNIM
ncbi:Ig-like domain-containing protein [Psychromonas sp. Urea-02u-13]|uniref:Ig-like domain-containing protein n=1 Tax=Psychromonas sp. Urea-02u-13 TaxID=2058326 RepID=UPI000C328286|nr:Ig-like domain-containing protein [Psychromonas sp. Urea-02u-13]PKG37151.1 hypothetical protein CXF74_20380 [Psychromonas sp. Urea-02u-13]